MKTVGIILLCAAYVCAHERMRFGTCSFPDVDLEPAVDDLLKRLPESYNLADATARELLPGVTVGNTTLLGLSKMEMRGAPQLYCLRGKPMLEISVHGFARFSAPWRYCGGKMGQVSTTSSYVTLSMLFEVSNVPVALSPVNVWLTWLDGTYFLLSGINDSVDIGISALMSKVFPAVVRDFWVEALDWNTRKILKEIASA